MIPVCILYAWTLVKGNRSPDASCTTIRCVISKGSVANNTSDEDMESNDD